MAGPVQSYLITQLAAQEAVNVPFGLITLVNSSINTAIAAGEFNVTIDCSLFLAEDVSTFRIYLESLGYIVEFAKDNNAKSLLIKWDVSVIERGDEVVVDQGTNPWIISGSVVENPATTAVISAITVTTASTLLLPSNVNRRGFVIQCKTTPLYIILGETVSPTLFSYYLLKLNSLEIDNYVGPVAAVVATGSATVMVTEKL